MNMLSDYKGVLLVFGLFLIFFSAPAGAEKDAAQAGPQELIKHTTDQVLAALVERRDELKQDDSRIYEFVEQYLLPHFDNRYIAQLVLGRHWRRASPEQRDRFMKAFQEMLIRSYASSMLEYSDQKINYLSYQRPGEGEDETVVKTEIETAAGPVAVDYSLHKKEGRWLVFDVTIDGISMIVNYRSNINTEIRRLNSLAALIDKIEERNRQTDANG